MTEQRDVTQTVREVEYAATSATGNAVVNITNYYYHEETKVASVKPANAAVDDNLPCPYRGLLHFSPNDTEFFFGREVFVEKLVQATATRNFIPVLGASGSGKSSVVLAGLVPELQKQGNWLFTHFRPGSDPFQKLAEALVPLYAPDLDKTDRIAQTRKLANYLDKGEVILTDVINNIQRSYPHHRVLLIADQFEELYTLCGDEKTRQHFLDCLLTIIQSPNSASDSVVVTTMRADFLEKALSYRPFLDVLQNDIKLGAMNREERKEVIEKPAQKLGVIFQDGLVERILEDVEQQPGSLPLLEFALTLLWEKREDKQLTHTAYEEIGEVKGALASHADQVYRNLNLSEQQQVRRIFMQLVRPGEGMEDTRRVATKSELGEASWSLVKHLADADARLVVTSQNATQEVTVEVVHEALIRHWQLLGNWIDENRSKIIQKNRIERLAIEWRENKQVKDYLLQGKQLNQAKTFHKKEAANFRLSDLASDLIQKTIRHRRNNRLKLIGGVGFIPLVALAVYPGVVVVERNIRIARLWDDVEAAEGKRESSARVLALQELVKADVPLDNISLQNYNLSYTILSGASLIRTNLDDADLNGANLIDADLNGANLSNADLSGANLSNTFLYRARLSAANLSNADLSLADLSLADLSLADLNSADFSGAKLNAANLIGANLIGANLSDAKLSRAKLSRAKLSRATLGCEDILVTEPPVCTNFQGAKELTPEQVKAAKDWDRACYDPEFRKKLGLSPKNPKNCASYAY